eukprot:TRINITY_DN597_c0_g1_i3.p1 TRINITY_DN597_c0_g1~~TRINITY_DN597_c0_g1_i3.p1  ORF type:complete len:178 (-),score=61.01 TRINITY_DN597_c0_g1_i3:103-636(-)
MQTDEDVGKIAMATPILISKALELFLQDLVSQTVEITNQKQSKTMTIAHLKQCVTSTQQFDFLEERVSEVPEIEPPKVERRGRPRKDGVAPAKKKKKGAAAAAAAEEKEEEEEEESKEVAQSMNEDEGQMKTESSGESKTDDNSDSNEMKTETQEDEDTESKTTPPRRTSKISDILN